MKTPETERGQRHLAAPVRCRIVLCSGLTRSGSTWAYNVCSELLSRAVGRDRMKAGYTGTGPSLDGRLRTMLHDPRVDAALFKFHMPTPLALVLLEERRALNVFTLRHPLAALASTMDMFGHDFEASLQVIEAELRALDQYRARPGTLLVPYSGLAREPATQVRRIADHLGVPASADLAERIAAAHSFDAQRRRAPKGRSKAGALTYDPDTLLHPGHMRESTARDHRRTLSDAQIATAEHRLLRWLPASADW